MKYLTLKEFKQLFDILGKWRGNHDPSSCHSIVGRVELVLNLAGRKTRIEYI